MTNFFVRFQATRELNEREMLGVLRALMLLREERAILGWRLAHEIGTVPRISLELAAESDADAIVAGGMLFVEVLAAADLERERNVFGRGEVVTRS